uniref:PH domain-containing protein n=1 Tax=Angiostrongylus cantonensis TaxID=6313 RepID=A0A158PC22_ANGCA
MAKKANAIDIIIMEISIDGNGVQSVSGSIAAADSSIAQQPPKPTILVSDVAEGSNNLPPLRNLNGFDSAPKVVLTDEELHENAAFVTRPPREIPRPSALCFNGDPSIHDRIIDELKRQGIIRSSDRSANRNADASSHDLRDRRLKKLHFAANEFYSVQKLFLKYLRDMGEVYPEYVMEYGKRFGKDLLAHQGSQPHVVRQLQLHYEQLIRVHQLLLEEFSSRLSVWDSLKPNMADVIIKYADFLKICKPFLLEKSRFVQELTQLRIENKDFDNATVAFEQKIFNRGVGAVVQQCLPLFTEAIAKLEKIAQSVNESMGLPSNEELFKLYDRFQCQFDVFYPGRRLIRQGEVFKQTRKEPQPRYLVLVSYRLIRKKTITNLFSDILWICRVMSGFGSSGLFDMSRSYGIPIETVRTESNSHEDYEQQLYVKSKYKSLILIMSNARERSQWQREIDDAREEKRKYRRRMNEAIERQRKQSLNPLALETPVSEDSYVADECHNGSSDRILPAITCDLPNGQAACNGHHLAL